MLWESKKHIHILDFHSQGSWLIISTLVKFTKMRSYSFILTLQWHFWDGLSWYAFCPLPHAVDVAFVIKFALTEFPFPFFHGNVITMNSQRHWRIFFWHLTVHMGLAWHLKAFSGWHAATLKQKVKWHHQKWPEKYKILKAEKDY